MGPHRGLLPLRTQSKISGNINAKEALPIRQAAIKMDHPQGPTPLQFDNKCAMGILISILKQRQSKGMDTHFYWLRDRHRQCQLYYHWKRSITQLNTTSFKDHYVSNNLTRTTS